MEQLLILIDADDTLWENNVYFERVIEEFIRFVDHAHYPPEEVRRILDDIERANIARHGYGSKAFGENLQQAYRHLKERPISDDELTYVSRLAESIAGQELEILEGVRETLEYLAGRHRLALVTKGHEQEQHAKVQHSGLSSFFCHTAILREKDSAAYRAIVEQLNGAPESSWMIGNSPRSDINPALAAGLNAVWIPHENTWRLENEELGNGPGRLVVVSKFARLRDIF